MALVALLGLVGIPGLIVVYIIAAEALLGRLPESRRRTIRPWLWLAPALLFLSVFLIYPAIGTVVLSVLNGRPGGFVSVAYYRFAVTDGEMLAALRNNAVWLLVFPAATAGLGLAVAALADRTRYETAVRSVLFMPMGISFVAASIIWKFVYAFRPRGEPQIGVLNALLAQAGRAPVAWLAAAPPVNTLALIVVGVWVWTGFCLVVLSAALKAIPVELPEAARVDGASEWQTFFAITVPLLRTAIAVVVTTMVIFALKAFDIVYVMTNGNFDTEVIATRMYKELFVVRDFGRASAIAVILFAATLPVVLANLRRSSEPEAPR